MYQPYKCTLPVPGRATPRHTHLTRGRGAISLKRRGIIATRAVATLPVDFASGQKMVHLLIPVHLAYTSTHTHKMASTKPLKTDWTADDEGEPIRRFTAACNGRGMGFSDGRAR